MKLHEVTKNEDGTVKIETELTPEETRALLHLGVMACIQNGVMVASLAPYFGGGEPVEDKEIDSEWEQILNRAEEYEGIDIEEPKTESKDNG